MTERYRNRFGFQNETPLYRTLRLQIFEEKTLISLASPPSQSGIWSADGESPNVPEGVRVRIELQISCENVRGILQGKGRS